MVNMKLNSHANHDVQLDGYFQNSLIVTIGK